MIIVGEKLNTSIQKTQAAVNARDAEYLSALARQQSECGADYLDVNTAAGTEDETESLSWLVSLVQENTDCGIMLDSPDPAAIRTVLPAVCGRPVIVNSVSLTSRLELLPQIRDAGASVVALPIGADGIPGTAAKRVENAQRLADAITRAGIPANRIFMDVLAESLAVSDRSLLCTLDTILAVRDRMPEIKTICGVSNVSFGLPGRVHINTAFLSAAVAAGLSAAILDITSPDVKTALLASLAMAGLDEYCLAYISHMRKQK